LDDERSGASSPPPQPANPASVQHPSSSAFLNMLGIAQAPAENLLNGT
jgi:hypothetical protein